MNIDQLIELRDEYNQRVCANYYVEENGVMYPRWSYYNGQRRIACAAINYAGIVLTGIRHHSPDMAMSIKTVSRDLLNEWLKLNNWNAPIQGFVDQYGMFLTRQQAWVVAKAANQIILDRYNERSSKQCTLETLPEHDTLYSEDYV